MQESNTEDGWERLSEQQMEQSLEQRITFPKTQPLQLLFQQKSLEPDMIFGWIPKLPSCPIPLSYKDQYLDQIMKKLKDPSNELYQLAYQGQNAINSVQMNRKFNYSWKYRSRYQIKVNALKEAVQNVGRNSYNQPQIKNTIKKDTSFLFDSSFQSGNLGLAVKIKSNQYDLFLRNDTNTRGHTNWFYFKVNNQQSLGVLHLNICNIVKFKNLYNKGMKPYVKIGKNGHWTQSLSQNISFVQRLCRYTSKTQNILQFQYTFTQQNTEIYFAYNIPYTYSNLLQFIKQIKEKHANVVKISSLCESLGGLDIPVIKISAKPTKLAILMTARIHPGESNSSHMIEGLIRSLLQENIENDKQIDILEHYTIYIVPMLNPDGVIAGNYRTSYSGRDLNRMFNELGNRLYPQVNGLNELAKNIKKNKLKIEYYFDFHGHSSKKNVFCYGPEHASSNPYFLSSRIFAKLISKETEMFDYSKSLFYISEHKKNTGRAHMLRKMGIPMSFTFQISNGFYQTSHHKIVQFDQNMMNLAGKHVLYALKTYTKYISKPQKISIFSNKSQKFIGNERLSLNRKKYPQRISLTTMHKYSNQSTDKNVPMQFQQNQHQFLDLAAQILKQQKKKCIGCFQEKGSDSQSSKQDLDDEQINQLFAEAKYINLQTHPSKYEQIDKNAYKGHKSTKHRESTRKSLIFNSYQKDQQIYLKRDSRDTYKHKTQITTFGQNDKKHRTRFRYTQVLPNNAIYKKKENTQEIYHFSLPKELLNSKVDKKALKQKRFPLHI